MIKFTDLTATELENISGGIVPIVITGAVVLKGIAAFGAGVTFGLALGKKF